MAQQIGVLTSGGDCPGLNAAIRGLGKAAREHYGMHVIGFLNGFRGIAQDQRVELDGPMLSGILTDGGTILGTSRDKPHRMNIGGKETDMTDAIIATYHRHHLDALVCIGGGGTQKNALRLAEAGLNIVTLPKTIDNDIFLTDRTFGFDTALQIATEAIDRLHSTATSHERIIVLEVMGHRAGWLALEAGIAGGADVILLPEIPFDIECVAEAVRKRTRSGKRFSIIVVAEGAMTKDDAREVASLVKSRDHAESKKARSEAKDKLRKFHDEHVGHTIRLTRKLEKLTGQETRLTILGHLQRGGTPSAADRVFATWLGTYCADVLNERKYGVMVGLQGTDLKLIPLADLGGRIRHVPLDHPLITSGRRVGTSFGD
jgi:ATP-dependent phosphofructokinase / diphosphate-dependent phosphofructokinase